MRFFFLQAFYLSRLHLYLFHPFFAASPSFAASAPSADASPSAPSTVVSSAGFSGSLITVGAATVAITKSRSVIVGMTLSGSFTEEIFILVPISVPAQIYLNFIWYSFSWTFKFNLSSYNI